MFEVQLMRQGGRRLSPEERAKQVTHRGEFLLDVAHGARRLRIRDVWSHTVAPIELFDPVLISASNGRMLWRGFERVDDCGVVQEWIAVSYR